MRTAQVLIIENDSLLTAMLEGLVVQKQRCLLRHPRDLKECLELLRDGGPSVVVLRLSQNVEEEMGLAAEVANLYPDAGLVVVGEPVHAPLAGLAWDLGADYVLILPQPRELLPEIVAGLLRPAGVP
jgi:DNA-binding NarL/FixJ family response regulator